MLIARYSRQLQACPVRAVRSLLSVEQSGPCGRRVGPACSDALAGERQGYLSTLEQRESRVVEVLLQKRAQVVARPRVPQREPTDRPKQVALERWGRKETHVEHG